MSRRKLVKSSWCYLQKRLAHKNAESTKSRNEISEISRIRNIGILAHIDAGKTTTTERMLYYSGLINTMGEVHHGNTVTDYLEQERQRGITITSAAVTFNWKKHRVNLIDTPGHIDFTMEVEQSLKVLDGGIIILDGTAGVEAQTLTVCSQADKYNIPRIIYVNKMDRPKADFDMNLKSIRSRLNVEALPIQFPIKQEGVLEGIVDVLFLEKVTFDKTKQGSSLIKTKLSEKNDGALWEMACERRRDLTDKLSGMDDNLADIIIQEESLDDISAQILADSLRKVTSTRQAVPILLGSSYKNIGVQPLMDAVVLYLPNPRANPNCSIYKSFNNNLSARVFKIVHDPQKGAITFLRLYSGQIKKSQKLYNVRDESSETIGRLYIPFANEYEEVEEICQGNIAAVTGLKNTVTGDLITINASAAERAKQTLLDNNVPGEEVEEFFAARSDTLSPVFFCTIEPASLSVQARLDTALKQLQREDPGLQVTYDEENDQTILAGMGELHLEIIKDRIQTQYKVEADLSSLQISYKETMESEVKDTFHFEQMVGSKKHQITLEMSLIPNYKKGKMFHLDTSREYASQNSHLHHRVLHNIKAGVESAFRAGPKLCYPVVNVTAVLHTIQYRCDLNYLFAAATSQCIRKLLKNTTTVLLEPIMYMEVTVPENYGSTVLADLSKRRAEIHSVDIIRENKLFVVHAPLAELLGYSTTLRTITSGQGSFSQEFSHYRKMDAAEEARAIKAITGF